MLLGRWIRIGRPSSSGGIVGEPVLVLGCLERLSHAEFTVRAFDDIVSRCCCHVLLWLLGVIVLPSVGRLLVGGCLDSGAFRLQRLSANALLLLEALCMDRCDALVIVELKLGLVDEPLTVCFLQLQVVARRDMIMLVSVDTFEHVILFEAQLAQFFEDDRVDRNLRESNKDATCDAR